MTAGRKAGSNVSPERWCKAWAGLQVRPTRELEGLRERLLAAWAEPRRHYHTQQHLTECFARFDELADCAARPAEVELALWFHDAIYDTRRSDNEQKSAEWARAAALAAGAAAQCADRLHALVMATRHEAVPVGPDEEVLVDVDLSILGAGPERFEQYDRQVRAEYAWVPGFLYRRKRRQVLEQFLQRPRLYATARFHERLEPQARRNLEMAIRRLGGRP